MGRETHPSRCSCAIEPIRMRRVQRRSGSSQGEGLMNRLFLLAGFLALAAIVLGTHVQAEDKDSKFEISKFMKKSHGKDGLRAKITKAVLNEKDYDSAKEVAKEWLTEAQKLTKATPPKGETASWEKRAGDYCKTVKALAD